MSSLAPTRMGGLSLSTYVIYSLELLHHQSSQGYYCAIGDGELYLGYAPFQRKDNNAELCEASKQGSCVELLPRLLMGTFQNKGQYMCRFLRICTVNTQIFCVGHVTCLQILSTVCLFVHDSSSQKQQCCVSSVFRYSY